MSDACTFEGSDFYVEIKTEPQDDDWNYETSQSAEHKRTAQSFQEDIDIEDTVLIKTEPLDVDDEFIGFETGAARDPLRLSASDDGIAFIMKTYREQKDNLSRLVLREHECWDWVAMHSVRNFVAIVTLTRLPLDESFNNSGYLVEREPSNESDEEHSFESVGKSERFNAECTEGVVCPSCCSMFPNRRLYDAHTKTCMKRPNSNNKCIHCSSKFCSKGNLVRHIKNIHARNVPKCSNDSTDPAFEINFLDAVPKLETDRQYPCYKCKKSLASKIYLKLHVPNCAGNFLYKCSTCEMYFLHENHLKMHPCQSKKSESVCFICGKAFTHKSQLQAHMHICSSNYCYKCEACERPFETKQDLHYHERDIHHTLAKEQATIKYDLDADVKPSIVKQLYECISCAKTFLFSGRLLRHLRMKHKAFSPAPTFVFVHCKCGLQFDSISNFTVHQKSCVGNVCRCKECGNVYSNRRNLTRHLRYKHSSKASHNDTLQCHLCMLSFRSKLQFEVHTHRCKGNYCYKCDICEKTFSRNLHLVAHKNSIHKKSSTSSVYTCKQCGVSFKTDTYVSLHKSKCKGNYGYKCDLCEKTYCQNYHLNSHINAVHKKIISKCVYYCKLCRQSFKTNTYVRMHKAKCRGNYSHKCDICEKTYSQRSHLYRHRLNSHKKTITRIAYSCSLCKSNFSTHTVYKLHQAKCSGHRCYKCETCERTFSKVAYLKKHKAVFHTKLEEVDSQQLHTCKLCKLHFNSAEHYGLHVRKCTGKYTFKCEVCESTFIKFAHLLRHTQKHNELRLDMTPVKRPNVCRFCNLTFYSETYFKLHQQKCSGNYHHKCAFCEKTFNKLSLMHWHMNKCNNNTTKMKSANNKVCLLCNLSFDSSSFFKLHTLKCRGNYCHKCTKCERTFYLNSHLLKHEQAVHGKCDSAGGDQESQGLLCKLCDTTFKGWPRFQEHVKKCTGSHKFKCDRCEASYTCGSSLGKHSRVRHGAKPTPRRTNNCRLCRLTFSSNVALEKHKEKCNGNYRFKCETCETTFTKVQNLVRHNAIHKEVKDTMPQQKHPQDDKHKDLTGYTCEICEKRFTLQINLRRHTTQAHTKPNIAKPMVISERKCKLCGVSFRSNDPFKVHVQKCQGDYRHKCNICEQTFTLYHNFNRHVDMIHNKKKIVVHPLKTKLYHCKLCRSSFKRNGYYKLHIAKCKGKKCFKCKKAFRRSCDLLKHLRGAHIKLVSPKRTDKHARYCDTCQISFGSAEQHELHRSKCERDPTYKCEICEHSFGLRYALLRHMRRVHKKARVIMPLKIASHTCTACYASYKSSEQYKKHLNKCKKPSCVNCTICKRQFSTEKKLSEHRRRVHETQRTCSKCTKSFNSDKYFEVHQRKCTGFTCKNCLKTFVSNKYLLKHLCNRKGLDRDLLMKQCRICAKTCASKQYLIQHLHKCSRNFWYVCDVCQKRLSSKSHLLRHKRGLHKM